MSPERWARRAIEQLRRALLAEREVLIALQAGLERARAEPMPPEARAYALAALLHHVYTAVESVMERVARNLDEFVPEGREWHRELLQSMTRPLEGVRPPLWSEDSARALHRLLGFRHFFRHAYAVKLDLGLLEAHTEALLGAAAGIFADLDRLIVHLAAMAESVGAEGEDA